MSHSSGEDPHEIDLISDSSISSRRQRNGRMMGGLMIARNVTIAAVFGSVTGALQNGLEHLIGMHSGNIVYDVTGEAIAATLIYGATKAGLYIGTKSSQQHLELLDRLSRGETQTPNGVSHVYAPRIPDFDLRTPLAQTLLEL